MSIQISEVVFRLGVVQDLVSIQLVMACQGPVGIDFLFGCWEEHVTHSRRVVVVAEINGRIVSVHFSQ